MTHSGGKPHKVGDEGQRYEITFFNPHTGTRSVYGWADIIETAEMMANNIRQHPAWHSPQITDRLER